MDVKNLILMHLNASSEEEKQKIREQSKKEFDALSPEEKKEAQRVSLEYWDAKVEELKTLVLENIDSITNEQLFGLASIVKDYYPKSWQRFLRNNPDVKVQA